MTYDLFLQVNTSCAGIKLPFANLLRNIESTQRYLKMENRDHLIHQFQVFLLGAIFIKKHKADFLKYFAGTFKIDDVSKGSVDDFLKKKHKSNNWNNADMESVPTIEYLLKLSWFLTSVYHDVGYPVEAIDKVVDGLRKEVADLLSIDSSYYKDSPEFKIDPVLYDDPRAYIILKEVSHAIAGFIRNDGVEDKKNKTDKEKRKEKSENEQWWYFFRYLAFEEKRHEFISALTLGLKFAEANGDINKFIDTDFGKFLIRNVLMPIILHHISKWGKKRSSKNNKYENSSKLKRDAVDSLLPKLVNVKFDFKRHPIAALLAFCDSIQETGRPSGAKKEEWPDTTEDIFIGIKQCNEGKKEVELYNVKYAYKGFDDACSLDRCQKDC